MSNRKRSVLWISISTCLAGSIVGAALLYCRQSTAHGAFALGLPTNIAREGVAIGWAVNYPDEETAKAKAMEHCASSKQAEPAVRANCDVVRPFKDACLAIALDREPGTRGFGWAVQPTLEAARKAALAQCIETSTRTREGKCEIVDAGCDGSWWPGARPTVR